MEHLYFTHSWLSLHSLWRQQVWSFSIFWSGNILKHSRHSILLNILQIFHTLWIWVWFFFFLIVNQSSWNFSFLKISIHQNHKGKTSFLCEIADRKNYDFEFDVSFHILKKFTLSKKISCVMSESWITQHYSVVVYL